MKQLILLTIFCFYKATFCYASEERQPAIPSRYKYDPRKENRTPEQEAEDLMKKGINLFENDPTTEDPDPIYGKNPKPNNYKSPFNKKNFWHGVSTLTPPGVSTLIFGLGTKETLAASSPGYVKPLMITGIVLWDLLVALGGFKLYDHYFKKKEKSIMPDVD